jgi:hypothetical protein
VNDTSRSGSLDALADGPLPNLVLTSGEEAAQMHDDAAAEAECKTLGTKSGLPKIITTMRQALNLGLYTIA